MTNRHSKAELDQAMRDLLHAELESAAAPHQHGAAAEALAKASHAIDGAGVHEALQGWTPKLN